MLTRTPFFWRLYLNFSLFILLAIVTAGWILSISVADKNAREKGSNTELFINLQAPYFLQLLQMEDAGQMNERIRQFASESGLRLTLTDHAGRVVADSTNELNAGANMLQRPEFLQAQQFGKGRAETFSQTLGTTYHYYAVALSPSTSNEGTNGGFLRAGYSLEALEAQTMDELITLYGELAAITVFLLIVAMLLALRLARPVEQITTLAETIAKGDFDRRLPVNQVGLGKLAHAINQLARTSAQRVSSVTADRNRLAAIFAGMVEGVIDVDEHMHIQHINDAAVKLLKLNTATCLKKPIWEQVRIKAITTALDQAMKGRDVVKSQMRLSRERDELVVNIYAASLSNESGEPLGAVIVLNDITELENLSRVRTDFVANASHELKTPITAIRGLAETVLSDEQIERTDVFRFMDRIHAQSMRLSHLVSDLMAISRLESIQQEQEFEPVNLLMVVRHAIHSVQANVEAKQQHLKVSLPEQGMIVSGDRQNLNQLVDNLLDNAVKYTQDGGNISVSLVQDLGMAVLEVKDNGIGISHQYHQRVFERFYRVDKVRSQSLGGTGLGLSIVKNIVENHYGEVVLKSHPGAGSTFTIRLPLER